MTDAPTEKEFRETGFTADAINYPLSATAFIWLCRFNGIPVDKAPRTWRYAPNAGMHDYMERKAKETNSSPSSGRTPAFDAENHGSMPGDGTT